MKKIFLITILSIFLGLIFLPGLIEAQGSLGELKAKICEVVRILRGMVPAAGGLALAVTGILFMFSGASPSLHNQAKQALVYIVIGTLIISGAAEIVGAVGGGGC